MKSKKIDAAIKSGSYTPTMFQPPNAYPVMTQTVTVTVEVDKQDDCDCIGCFRACFGIAKTTAKVAAI